MQTKADLEKTIADQKESIKFHQWVTGILIVAFLALVAWHMQTSYNEAKDVTKARADIDAFALLKKTATTNQVEMEKLRAQNDKCEKDLAQVRHDVETNEVLVAKLLQVTKVTHLNTCRSHLVALQMERMVGARTTGKIPKQKELINVGLFCPSGGDYIFNETNSSVRCTAEAHNAP